jgi:hypothetical protein
MAKKPKPETFQHAPNTPVLCHDPNDPKTRKRLIRKGRYKDTRAEKFGKSKVEKMTAERWKNFIHALSEGLSVREACKHINVTPMTVDAYLITNVAAYKQIRDAQLASIRRRWDHDLLDKIFNELAMGSTLKAAAIRNGLDNKDLGALYMLVRKDKAIRAVYDVARELQAESFLDEIIDISDDSGKDRLENGRVNHEVVNRSKLKIETRKFAMGSMVKKRFGEHKHVEHEGNISVNHIALLTGARKRLERQKLPPVKEPVVIENETGEVSA